MQILIKIHGQVQGVFFRVSAKEKADELGLFGYAKNADDGTVEIVAEGEKEKLEEFLSWCKAGPKHAKIEKVDVKWYNKKEEYKDFKIIY